MKRSAIRGKIDSENQTPDCATLHPGYGPAAQRTSGGTKVSLPLDAPSRTVHFMDEMSERTGMYLQRVRDGASSGKRVQATSHADYTIIRVITPMNVNIETDTFVLNPRYRLQWEAAQNCHVLLYPEGLIQLSGSAAEIMQRCASPTTLAEIVADLEKQFPDAEGIAEDVKEFLQDAQQQQWIVASQT